MPKIFYLNGYKRINERGVGTAHPALPTHFAYAQCKRMNEWGAGSACRIRYGTYQSIKYAEPYCIYPIQMNDRIGCGHCPPCPAEPFCIYPMQTDERTGCRLSLPGTTRSGSVYQVFRAYRKRARQNKSTNWVQAHPAHQRK